MTGFTVLQCLKLQGPIYKQGQREYFRFLSTEWVDYVEEPMKYQALRPHFFSMVGGGRVLGVGVWWWGGSWDGWVVVLWVPMTHPSWGCPDAPHVIF